MTRNLKFGVELEVATSKSAYQIVETLKENGINAVVSRYGSPVNHEAWKVHRDGSLGQGWEIVSPPLTNTDELEKVVSVLRNQLKVRCNKKTGLHIHHDINDFSIEQIKSLYKIYDKYEEKVLKTIINPKRYNNSYCRTIHYVVDRVERCENIEQFKRVLPTRYLTLNLESNYVKYGTAEFRQHQGTIHWEEIIAWVKLTHKFIEAAAELKGELKALPTGTNDELLVEMFHELKLDDQSVLKHYRKVQKYIEKVVAR